MTTVLNVDLVGGRVYDADRTVHLHASEWELLWALELRGRPVPRTELASMLLPDADDDHALGAVDARMHRLRARIGTGTIQRTTWGYQVAQTANVDLRTYERFVREMRAWSEPTAAQIRRCREMYDAVSAWQMPTSLMRSEFAATIESRLDAVRRELEQRLARHALAEGRAAEALSVAERALERDACDEWAWDVAIRAHLARGDRSAALRDFRRYSSTLAGELGVAPSREMRELITTPVREGRAP